MIAIKLTAQHLGSKVKTVDETKGTIKAYNNNTQIAFVVVAGKVEKHPYNELSLC